MIKVGDWVKYKSTGEIARVCVVDNDKYINGVCIDDCIKLPIRFKEFEVKQVFYGSWGFADGVSEHRKIIQGNSYAKFFTEAVDETMKLFIGHVGKPHSIKSNPMPIIQARDWLELQYATMIVEARGLV